MTNEHASEASEAADIPPDLSADIAADPARRNVALALGETDPAVLDGGTGRRAAARLAAAR